MATRFHLKRSSGLHAFEQAIEGLERLLAEQADADEEVFQNYLTENPLVLDVYGEVIPKPNFIYPEGSSPLGKTFVQPDFLVRRHPSSYRLIELERPSKKMATKRGESRAEVTQAVFQIAEFKGLHPGALRPVERQVSRHQPGVQNTRHR